MLEHLKETDFGTPRRESAQEVTLEIDGESVTVPAGTSLMRAQNAETATNIEAKERVCATDSSCPLSITMFTLAMCERTSL